MNFGSGNVKHIIENNKRLLKKESFFKKERSFMNRKKEYLKTATNKNVNLNKATKEELRRLRETIIRKRKKYDLTVIVVFLIMLIGIILIVTQTIKTDKSKVVNQQLDVKTKKFKFFMRTGQEWLAKDQLHNAIFEFEEAQKLFPKNHEVNAMLLEAYELNCLSLPEYCDKANEQKKFIMTLKQTK